VDSHASTFETHRAQLIGVAYRMLGSSSEAEDIVQDAYLRWHHTDTAEVRSPKAWLLTAVTRLAIDRLRELRAERETYVGPWLPEPLMTETEPPADEASELASNLSVAFLVVLERLAPEERAAFLLHEVFDSDYGEIAQILGKSAAACRQVVSRARKRVREDRPRVHVSDEARKRVLQQFMDALVHQDKQSLLQLVAADATWTSDGGGKAKAARKTIHGRDSVVRFAMGVLGRHADRLEFRLVTVNAEAGIAVYLDGRLLVVISMQIDGSRILAVYSVLNPDKLHSCHNAAGSFVYEMSSAK
jgi:RNA polymerase sigma-70 factor, ECF subfamily